MALADVIIYIYTGPSAVCKMDYSSPLTQTGHFDVLP